MPEYLGRRGEPLDDRSPIRIGKRNLDREADGNDAEQGDDERLDPAEPEPLKVEDEEDIQRGDDHTDLKRNAEDKVQPDRCADHFGDVGRDDGDFSHEPQAKRDGLRERIAAGLGEVPSGSDRETCAKRLKDDRHDVRHEGDDQQRITELGTASERGRPVSRIHISDGDEVARADEGRRPAPGRALRPDGDRPMHIGERCFAAIKPPSAWEFRCPHVHGKAFSRKCNSVALIHFVPSQATPAKELGRTGCSAHSMLSADAMRNGWPALRARGLRSRVHAATLEDHFQPGLEPSGSIPPPSRGIKTETRSLTSQ